MKQGALRGRQFLFMIKRYFAVDNSDKVSFELQSMFSHTWDGDENMEGWKAHWDYLMENQETPITSKQAETIFFNHVKPSKAPTNYILYYERLQKGERERTYEYLCKAVDKHVDEKRQRNNMLSCSAGRQCVRKTAATPALDADGNPTKEAKPKGKGHDTGKGKDGKGKGRWAKGVDDEEYAEGEGEEERGGGEPFVCFRQIHTTGSRFKVTCLNALY